MDELRDDIKALSAKARVEHDAGDAMKLAQAALNLANALAVLKHVE